MADEFNPQSRAWVFTINNPQDCDMDHEAIIERLSLSNPRYFCMADEIATTGTYHTHIYARFHSPIRFKTLKKRFPAAHMEAATGTSWDNRNYIRKEGKWAETDKAETRVEGTFYEFGEVPDPSEERSPKMFQLLNDIRGGKTTLQIIDDDPGFAFRGREIDTLRDSMKAKRFMTENRPLKVCYLYGDSGTGKTRSIFQAHPPQEICRITDYGARTGLRFDAYHSQDVMVFEEFHNQVPIGSMLNYLDIYPLMLPARYNDRVACYTTVYITSNIPLEEQYKEIQKEKPETWNAFLRRIHSVKEFRRGGVIREVRHDEG